jgi:hypothetical protein
MMPEELSGTTAQSSGWPQAQGWTGKCKRSHCQCLAEVGIHLPPLARAPVTGVCAGAAAGHGRAAGISNCTSNRLIRTRHRLIKAGFLGSRCPARTHGPSCAKLSL